MPALNIDVTLQLQHPRWKTLLRPYCKTVRESCAAALAGAKPSGKIKQWEMAVVLADDGFIRELNRDYRGKDAPTNVLSFPYLYPAGVQRGAGSYVAEGDPVQSLCASQDDCNLGDIILAIETIEREAVEQGKKVKDHAKHLLVHGTLHLLGYDHEDEKDAVKMEGLEVKILKKLGVANPYL